MTLLIEAAKAIGGPGSLGFLALWLVIAFVLRRLGGGWRVVSRGLFALLVALYFVLSLPPVANTLAEALTTARPLAELSALTSVRTIVVFDGDNRRGRVSEAKRLFDALRPEQVVISGEQWMLDELLAEGIPQPRLVQESASRNTREQIAMVRQYPPRSVVIVASRFQIPRIILFLGPNRDDVFLAPSPADAELSELGAVGWWIPRYRALRISRDVLYELAALRYYRAGVIGT